MVFAARGIVERESTAHHLLSLQTQRLMCASTPSCNADISLFRILIVSPPCHDRFVIVWLCVMKWEWLVCASRRKIVFCPVVSQPGSRRIKIIEFAFPLSVWIGTIYNRTLNQYQHLLLIYNSLSFTWWRNPTLNFSRCCPMTSNFSLIQWHCST